MNANLKKLLFVFSMLIAVFSMLLKYEVVSAEYKEDGGQKWLKSVFKCRHTKGFCYYLDKEESICTKRFMRFLIESNAIYGATNLTDAELPNAERIYKEKWSKIYPLHKEEMWLLGRGQDDMVNIKDVKIVKISHLKYKVFVDYGDGLKTANEVTLIQTKSSYKIDYCKTQYVQ